MYSNATRVIADASAHGFWDGSNLSGIQYRQILGWGVNAWDVYMVYGPKAHGPATCRMFPIFSCTRLPRRAAARCFSLRNES
jgi:hypothetical protein